MLHAYVPHLGGLAPLPDGEDLVHARWVDLYRPLEPQVRALAKLGVEVPTLEDMEEIEISNRLYREDGMDTMTAVLPGQTPEGQQVAMPVSFILTRERLVTVRHHAPRPFETFPKRADRCAAGVASPQRLFLGLVEEIVARLADLLETVGRVVDATAARVFSEVNRPADASLRDALTQLGQQSETMARVRLGLLTTERVVSFFSATHDEGRDSHALRSLAKTLNRDIQALEVHADYLGGRIQMTVDATLGLISLQQNNTVRILSVVAALFLPPTLIASIYGMNFETMPELAWRWGYPMALGMMAASAAATFLVLRWKRWL